MKVYLNQTFPRDHIGTVIFAVWKEHPLGRIEQHSVSEGTLACHGYVEERKVKAPTLPVVTIKSAYAKAFKLRKNRSNKLPLIAFLTSDSISYDGQ